jgi:hypothetical protein
LVRPDKPRRHCERSGALVARGWLASVRSSSAPVRRLNPKISIAGLAASFRVSKSEAFAPRAVTGLFDISPRPPATSAFCAVSPQGCAARPEFEANAPWKVRSAKKRSNCRRNTIVLACEGIAAWRPGTFSTSQDRSAPPPTHAAWAPDSVNVIVSGEPRRGMAVVPSGRPRVKREAIGRMKRVTGRSGRRANGPVRRVGKFFEHLLFEKRILRYDVQGGDIKPPQLRAAADRVAKEKKFFIWIRCNPLKSPDSAKGIQRNTSLSIWFFLVWLGDCGQNRAKSGLIWSIRRRAGVSA